MTRSRTAVAAVVLAVAASSWSPRASVADSNTTDHVVAYSDKTMGTRVSVQLWTDDETAAAKAAKKVFDEFDRVDRLMTSWLDDSDVSKINDAAGKKAVVVDAEVYTVIKKAMEISKASNGAFDITVGAFRGLWKFDQDRDGTIPDAADVKKRLKLVNYKNVVLNDKKRSVKLKNKGMRITLGGIAKGYAVDKAIGLLHNAGFVDFIIQAGGDLYVSGKKGAKNWTVGIRDPRGGVENPFAVAWIENRTFSTSGDYERSVVKDGVRYHHIIDPATGNPADKSRSVTVMTSDAFTADAWSTALFVMGADAGMKLVEKTDDLDAVFVDSDNKVHTSSGLSKSVKIYRQPTDGV